MRFLSDAFERKEQESLPEEDAERIVFRHMDLLVKAYLRLGALCMHDELLSQEQFAFPSAASC